MTVEKDNAKHAAMFQAGIGISARVALWHIIEATGKDGWTPCASQDEMADIAGMARRTYQRAIDVLERRGIIERCAGHHHLTGRRSGTRYRVIVGKLQ